MATPERTSQADGIRKYLNTLELPPTQDESNQVHMLRQFLLQVTRFRIDALAPKLQPVPVPPQVFENEPELDDLLKDNTYEQDRDFTRSTLDLERQTRMREREKTFRGQKETVKHLTQRFQDLEGIPSMIDAKNGIIEQCKQAIDALDTSFFRGIKVWWNPKKRPDLVALRDLTLDEVKQLESQLPDRDKNRQETRDQLEAEQQALDVLHKQQPNMVYNFDILHAPDAVRFSARSEQSVLVSFDGNSKISIRFPGTPQQRDFARGLTFDFDNTRDMEAFVELLGKNITSEEYFYTAEDMILHFGLKFDEQFTPFPLEVVMIDDHEEFRIPQSVWMRFGKYVAVTPID